MNKKNIALSFAAALLSATSLCAAGGTNAVSGNVPEAYEISQTKKSQLKYARELLEHGMYAEARKIFSEYPADPVAGGYALMCDVKMNLRHTHSRRHTRISRSAMKKTHCRAL